MVIAGIAGIFRFPSTFVGSGRVMVSGTDTFMYSNCLSMYVHVSFTTSFCCWREEQRLQQSWRLTLQWRTQSPEQGGSPRILQPAWDAASVQWVAGFEIGR